jgi:anti-sigma factor RsiW
MNCRRFKDLMDEYLDETLAPLVQDAAKQHVQSCAECQRALLRETKLTQSLRQGFATVTDGLALRPGLHRNVLKALESKTTPADSSLAAWRPSVFRRLGPGLRFVLRPLSLSVAFLCVLIMGAALYHYSRLTEQSVPQPVAIAALDAPTIDVPLPAQTYVFRRDDGMVTDNLAATVAVARAGFFQDGTPFSKN